MGIVFTCAKVYSVISITNEITSRIPIKATMVVLIAMVIICIVTFYYTFWRNRHERNQEFGCIDYFEGGRELGREGFAQVRAGSNSYKVHEDLENPEGAAQIMDKLNTAATQLLNHLEGKYIKDSAGKTLIKPEYWEVVKTGVKAAKKNFKTANLEENIPERSGGDTSYVINKGSVFAMCLRDPRNGNKLDEKFNDLVFVLVHEISHLFCKEWGHSIVFWENFNFVLNEAVEIGLYKPTDYKKHGSPYCGIDISYSPLFDPKLTNYYK